MSSRSLRFLTVAGLMTVAAACGADEPVDKDRGVAAPVTPGDSKSVHSLEAGKYYITEIRNLQDGCGKEPTALDDPITAVPFILTNDGEGGVSVDFCSFEGRSVQGTVRGNKGTLAVSHAQRSFGGASRPATFAQDCRLDLQVTSDNKLSGQYVETQTSRNDVMRKATVDVPECTTSFELVMERSE